MRALRGASEAIGVRHQRGCSGRPTTNAAALSRAQKARLFRCARGSPVTSSTLSPLVPSRWTTCLQVQSVSHSTGWTSLRQQQASDDTLLANFNVALEDTYYVLANEQLDALLQSPSVMLLRRKTPASPLIIYTR
jgi:hypothetical protein